MTKIAPAVHKLHGLDHLRAFAISFVFLYHYSGIFAHPSWVGEIGSFGWTGVDLFFVLSGYLISSQLFTQVANGKQVSFRKFFIKRFFRIIPAYLIVVAIYFLFPFVHEREALAPLWKYLSFTQNFGVDLRLHGTFSHAWSLCIEEQFYLLLPLILIALVYFKSFKQGWILLFVLFAAGFAARLYAWNFKVSPYLFTENFAIYWYKWIYYPTYARLDGLLIGVTIAAIFQFRPAWKLWLQQHAGKCFAIGLFLLIIALFVCSDPLAFTASMFGFTIVSIGYGFVVIAAISPRHFLYRFHSGVTTFIAGISYALYLTHKMTIHVVQEQLAATGIDKNGTLMLTCCIIASLLVAWILNVLVERPFLKLRDRLNPASGQGRDNL